MPSRRRRAQAAAWLLATGLALGAAAADAQSIDGLPESRLVEWRERFTPDDGEPIELRFLIAPEAAGQADRVVNATHAALAMLSGWFGPLSARSLTVAAVPWRASGGAAPAPSVITAPIRWLSPVRDQSTERALIGAIVRQYWRPALAPAPATPFEQALILYTSTRAIHHQLEGSNFATLRFFGGIVPFSLRSILLSPPVADPRPRAFGFDEPAPADADVVRLVRALQTLERYVGWPTMLQALSKMRTARGSTADAAALGDELSAARGADMRVLVTECVHPEAVFDYALADLHSRPGSSGLVETTLTIVRRGPRLFSNGRGAADSDALMPVRVRFAGGHEVRDFFDGAAPSTSLVYTAPTAAVSATVDPDLMLVLDVNRGNNAIVRDARIAPLGIRLALNWMAWLQNTVLSYTAVL